MCFKYMRVYNRGNITKFYYRPVESSIQVANKSTWIDETKYLIVN